MRRSDLLPMGLTLTLVFMAAGMARAETNSTVELFQVKSGNGKLTVTAPYAGDANGNNTLKIEWGLQDTPWADPEITTVELPHTPTPYRYTIENLNNHTAYQVRVTLRDPDGIASGSAEQIFLQQVPYNPLIHSSRSTESSKWPDGWGIPGGQYGEYTCATCHKRNSTNIKRIQETIAGQSVAFQSTVSGSADFGDDSRAGDTPPNGVCEVCHSRNAYYNSNTTNNTGGSHYNKGDCASCHLHKEGFRPDCTACHPYPPPWGNHQAHTTGGGGMMEPLGCVACHDTAIHRNELSEVRYDAADARLTGAGYTDQGGDESSRYTYTEGGGNYGPTPVYGRCTTLYCHSAGLPFDRANTYREPTWGGGAMTCTSCHAAGGAASSTMSGRHTTHTGGSAEKPYTFACARCHANTVTAEQSIKDPALHVNRQKEVAFPEGGSYSGARVCTNTYCHGDGNGGVGRDAVNWGESADLTCASCHQGRIGDATQMESAAHLRLANTEWIRQYRCSYCHYGTIDAAGTIIDYVRHVDGVKDVAFDPKWAIPGKPAPSYDPVSKVCLNLYCHSDGTAATPQVRDFPWTLGKHAACDSCHGHDESEDCGQCHSGIVPVWSPEDQWKRAMPMYVNTGPGTERANSHLRHLETNFSCEKCHFETVVGACGECHTAGIPEGVMTEIGHVNADKHVNKIRDVDFSEGGTYDPRTKSCANTACHTGDNPVWGDSVAGEVICLSCHGTTEADVDDFDAFNGVQARINMNEWFSTGHGRKSASGPYASGNPPANFPGNPCWYCHDNEVLHKDAGNPFRLKMHPQFESRFEKECVYCHMERTDQECLGCHNAPGSLAQQLDTIVPPQYFDDHSGYAAAGTSCLTSGCHLPMNENLCLDCHGPDGSGARKKLLPGLVYVASPEPPYSLDHAIYADGQTNCLSGRCHSDDAHIHNTGASVWSADLKADIKNQYMMMGVCLQCHDDNSNGRCTSCHTGDQYKLGYDPGTGFISGSSQASSTHFGYQHFAAYERDGEWLGGKFCWDCHDAHGDNNIYMIQNQVSLKTDGTFGIPLERATVVFNKKQTGLDYAKNSPPYNGICNVCHNSVEHYRNDYGDGHQSGRVCTSCHNHTFTASHASGQSCKECHKNKPVANHTGFGQSRDCVKCHEGAIKKRMDIMRQFRGASHHVQGVEVTNRHCYACHWESTADGLINRDYHEGYNDRTHQGTPNAKNDLVIWGAGVRPTRYELGVTATTFVAEKIGTDQERAEVAKVNDHCLGCHSDQNNDTDTFGDCKTPRQYAWDRSSIASRFLAEGVTNRGKYPANPDAARKIQTKAYSAHGNAVANEGGWSPVTGEDGALPNTRAGNQNVQCYDCHSSHGSYTEGVTSSYLTFKGNRNGGLPKETQAGKGGYPSTYRAQAKTDGVNPMAAGAAQCFDCHETADGAAGGKPWGYQSTFGASQPIRGYLDAPRFGSGLSGTQQRFPYRAAQATKGGHLQASQTMKTSPQGQMNGLCTSCHDPHGVTPSLSAQDQAYAVPLLKGTWLTSPYKEDYPQQSYVGQYDPPILDNVSIDRLTFGTTSGSSRSMQESDAQFAGLCLRCHPKTSLTDGVKKNTPFKSLDRIHESVKGWGNNAEHNFSCSKCHTPHSSELPRLMRTNCLDTRHRINPNQWSGEFGRFPTKHDGYWPTCHGPGGNPSNQYWNTVTPW